MGFVRRLFEGSSNALVQISNNVRIPYVQHSYNLRIAQETLKCTNMSFVRC